jgi:hypothetical protein
MSVLLALCLACLLATPTTASPRNLLRTRTETRTDETIASVATKANLTVLVAAVKAAGGDLLKTVTDPYAKVTVFAPTNEVRTSRRSVEVARMPQSHAEVVATSETIATIPLHRLSWICSRL